MVIEVNKVSYQYQSKYQKVLAVKNATCRFAEGRVYAITGASGSGKSTLLSLLAGLDLPSGGEILVGGRLMADIDRDQYRRETASVVYQAFHLFPLLTVLENVMLPMELKGEPKEKCREKARELLLQVGIAEEMHKKYPKMMSGGEQQRIAIARAMATGGKVLMADEPTGNLDSENETLIMDILVKLAHEKEYLVIVVTHNPAVEQRADIVYKMKDGILTQADNTEV